MRIKVLQSTMENPLDIDLEGKNQKNVFFCTTVEPSTTKEGNIHSDVCKPFLVIPSRGNKYIYFMYVYCCNAIMITATKNRSDK